MANAADAKIQYEGGQNQSPMDALIDSGDATTFESGAEMWSRRSGFEPVIRPDGLMTGATITPAAAGSNDTVDVSALTAYIGGEEVAASAETGLAVTRAADTNTHIIHSIVVDAAGTISAEAGTGGTSFSETRGSAGGPPLIPVDAIELGQVRLGSTTAAPVKASEIFQVQGLHVERYDYPIMTGIDYRNGTVSFASALPAIHVGDETKGVYASYAEAVMVDLPKGTDFQPSENSISVGSTQIYGMTLGSASTSLNQGSFTAYMENGVTDPMVKLKGEFLWLRFYPSKFKTAHILDHGYLGMSRSFPAGDEMSASCTISPETASEEVAS